jgi:uncharacterized protein
MKCPNCSEVLVMAERRGVEIDYCPTCRGVWLDRGELDRLLSLAETESAPQPVAVPARADRPVADNGYRDDRDDRDDRGERRKKRSWLSDMMEFD